MNKSLINPGVLTDLARLHREFDSARPFRHVVIDNFLKPEIADALLEQFPGVKDPSKLLNEFGTPNPKSAISEVRSLAAPYVEMDDYIQTDEFLNAMSVITGIPDLRYDPWYYGAGTHENFHTAGLDAHYDFNIHPKTAYHRRLNAIVYLNKDWNPDWKGEIAFHTDPWDLKNDQKTSVDPVFNRCVVFETTENSWHSVTPVDLPEDLRHLSRKSFTIYLYTETRPREETAPEHGTVYVQPPLPERIREGRTLDAQDMDDINANLARRHDYLKNMYKREYRFAHMIDELKAQLKDWKAASYVPVMGRAKVLDVAQPSLPDRWMGSALRFTLELRQDVSKLTAGIWYPEETPGELKVTFSAGDAVQTYTVKGGPSRLELDVKAAAGTVLEVSLSVDRTRRASDEDDRQISFIVDSIELD